MSATVDVLVVGAGPAGAAAALTARRRGLDVLVVDKATFPRDKTCGDGLTTAALRFIEHLGVDIAGLPGYMPVRETVLVAPDGRRVSLPLGTDGDYAAVVPRVELDAAIVDTARREGVEVRDGVGVTAIETTNGDGVTVTTGDGPVRARFLVAADGHYSFVRRCLRPPAPPELGTWHAFRQYFRGVDDPRLYVLFEGDLLPGYAWVFPLPGGRANVGFGVLRRPGTTGKELNARWRELLTRPSVRTILGPAAEPEATHRAWPIPASFEYDALADGRVLYVGDAANVVDPLTGEGIAQAIETAGIAVDTIATGDPETVGARYRENVRCALGRDLRFAAALQRVLRSRRGAALAVRTAGLTPWTRRHFARWMFEVYPRALLLTPDRWRRGMFDGTGAYRHG
ncbi:MAG TPA: geranylgeranyl reductase family protein [Acidimicrobiia bacterium]|nr:geranylgeranyl reductase family protein [Acidimicrobiia bacterium]